MTLSELSSNRIITLLTDFGYKDSFVGQMKGVMLSINPQVTIVDITHDIKNHDIEEASLLLWSNYRYFPKGTIHTAVVDPGVGSERKAVVAEIDNHYFLFPDNGLISYVLKDKSFKAFKIKNKKYILKQKSTTFQGRDVFAPAASWLSKGVRIENFGKEIKNLITFPLKEPKLIKDKERPKFIGHVIHIDKFGNAISNVSIFREKPKEVVVQGISLPVVNFYVEGGNSPAAVVNSDNLVEIFLYKGDASKVLNINKGTVIEVLIDG